MKDYYFSSTGLNALAGMLTTMEGGFFRVAYENILGPVKAKDGVYYVAIRAEGEITPPEGVNAAEMETAVEVLGGWA